MVLCRPNLCRSVVLPTSVIIEPPTLDIVYLLAPLFMILIPLPAVSSMISGICDSLILPLSRSALPDKLSTIEEVIFSFNTLPCLADSTLLESSVTRSSAIIGEAGIASTRSFRTLPCLADRILVLSSVVRLSTMGRVVGILSTRLFRVLPCLAESAAVASSLSRLSTTVTDDPPPGPAGPGSPCGPFGPLSPVGPLSPTGPFDPTVGLVLFFHVLVAVSQIHIVPVSITVAYAPTVSTGCAAIRSADVL